MKKRNIALALLVLRAGPTHAQEALEIAPTSEAEPVAQTTEVSHSDLELGTPDVERGIDLGFFSFGASATGAALIATVISGSLALARRGEVDACIASPYCAFTRNFDPDRAAIRDLSLITDALLITTGVLGATTFVLAFLTDFGGPSSSAIALHIQPNGFALSGSF